MSDGACLCAQSLSQVRLFCVPGDCSPPGSSVHGILQASILEWVAISFSRGSSQSKNRTQVSCIVGRFFTNWATREAPRIGREHIPFSFKDKAVRWKRVLFWTWRVWGTTPATSSGICSAPESFFFLETALTSRIYIVWLHFPSHFQQLTRGDIGAERWMQQQRIISGWQNCITHFWGKGWAYLPKREQSGPEEDDTPWASHRFSFLALVPSESLAALLSSIL